jgi:hypothetical protein
MGCSHDGDEAGEKQHRCDGKTAAHGESVNCSALDALSAQRWGSLASTRSDVDPGFSSWMGIDS